jgi:hypothetical protein
MSTATTGVPALVSDPAATESYYRQLYGSADSGFLPIWESQNKQTQWFAVTQLDAAANATCTLADQGLDVYHGMGLHSQPLGPAHRGEAAGVIALPGPYMDVDIKGPGHAENALPESIDDVLALLAAFPLPPSLLNFSGGGVHAHWLFREVLTIQSEADQARIASALKRLQAEIRRLARQSGYKLESTADLARVLRPAGTINYKVVPTLVSILEDSGERYLLEEIEDVLPYDVPAGIDTPSKEERRPAFEPIREGCAFMRHVVADAATLAEPDWHSGMTIVSLCANGEELAHQISAPYPRYTPGETQKKFERAVAADKPIGCKTIESRHGDDRCAYCQHRGTITNPIQLGYPPIIQPGRNGADPQADADDGSWPVLDAAALYGLAGDVVRTIEPHTEGDPAALLTSFLIMAGSAIGPSPHALVGATKHCTNENAVLVGETARARKGTATNEVKHIVSGADPHWKLRVMDGISSGEGLINAVRDPSYKPDKNGEMKLSDPGVEDKRLLAVEPEFSSVLRVAGRDGNTVSEILRRAWDGDDLRTLTRASPLVATSPHVSVLGHITKPELLRELSETAQANGFANRFPFFCVRRSKELPHGGALPESDIAALVDRVRKALSMARRIGPLSRDAETNRFWEPVYSALTAERPGMFGSITARADAHALRFSLLYALLDGAPAIRRPHVEAALAVWQYAEDSARFIFGDATGDPVADAILAALLANGRLTQTQISDLFGRNQKAGRLHTALALLLTARKVRTWQGEAEGGRAPTYWEALP